MAHLAKFVNTQLDRKKMVRGWSWLLHRIKLDLPLVNRGIHTDRKQAIIEASMSDIETWVQEDPAITRNQEVPAAVLYNRYRDRCEEQGLEAKAEKLESFWKKLTKVCGRGWAKRSPRKNRGFDYTIF